MAVDVDRTALLIRRQAEHDLSKAAADNGRHMQSEILPAPKLTVV